MSQMTPHFEEYHRPFRHPIMIYTPPNPSIFPSPSPNVLPVCEPTKWVAEGQGANAPPRNTVLLCEFCARVLFKH